LLPWFNEALLAAENVHLAEVDEKRRKGRARRANMSAEDRALEAETRQLYSNLYGQDLWDHAVAQANTQRARAELRAVTEHFTAVQWLNLAALQSFQCKFCGNDQTLETHHKRALHTGGDNKISNIELLCSTCHLKITTLGEDASDEWFELEMEKFNQFKIGDVVSRVYSSNVTHTSNGVVASVVPPQMGDGPLWCRRRPLSMRNGSAGKLIFPTQPIWKGEVTGYIPAKVRVEWTRSSGKKYKLTMAPEDIAIMQPFTDESGVQSEFSEE